MLRFLVRFLVFVVAVALIMLAVAPLLIDPTPAPGATSAETIALSESHFVDLPFPGTDGIEMHYLEKDALPNAETQPPSAQVSEPSGPSKGSKATFVLLHGFTFNAFTYNQLLDGLARYGRVVAYDQIPYGLSSKPLPGTWSAENPYSKAAARKRLFAFMDALHIDQAILVGNSSGGTLALEAALSNPERVPALILLSPWVHAKRPIFPDWFAQLPQVHRLTLLLARYLGETSPLLDYSYAQPMRIDDQRRALTGIHREMANWDAAWAALLNRSLTDPVEISAHLEEIRQPVLVISGELDQIVPSADTQATAAELPNAQFVEVPDCGHVPQEECPLQVIDTVSAWLQTVSRQQL